MHEFFDIITRSELCDRFNIHKDTLTRWIKHRNFPKPLRASGRIPLFSLKAINSWCQKMENSKE